MRGNKWVKIVIVVLVIAMLPAAIALGQGNRGFDKVTNVTLVRGQKADIPASGLPKVEKEYIIPNQNPLTLPDTAKQAAPSPLMPVSWKEGFEYYWPNSIWQTWDNTGYDNYCWNDVSYRHKTGGWSGYAGAGCSYPFYPPGPYASDMDSYMTLGPFSTSGAKKGSVEFQYWLDSEYTYDYLLWCASVDNYNFYCNGATGYSNNKWIKAKLDLKYVPGYGSMLGYPWVWVGWIFQSDWIVEYEGAYVDNIKVTIK
jgi:hypothetical protein